MNRIRDKLTTCIHDYISLVSERTGLSVEELTRLWNAKKQSFDIHKWIITFDQVPGLSYARNFISPTEEQTLLAVINEQKWNTDLARRTQHYGYKYNYKNRSIQKSDYLGPLPEWSMFIANKLYEKGLFPVVPNQLIVNEYTPGQGISAHTDSSVFGSHVAMISLGSVVIMDFCNNGKTISIPLHTRSVAVITDDARYKWTHCIVGRKSDTLNGKKVERGVRVSLTFRMVEN
jgi:alkylated DNA repair dioxygenase AlkB